MWPLSSPEKLNLHQGTLSSGHAPQTARGPSLLRRLAGKYGTSANITSLLLMLTLGLWLNT